MGPSWPHSGPLMPRPSPQLNSWQILCNQLGIDGKKSLWERRLAAKNAGDYRGVDRGETPLPQQIIENHIDVQGKTAYFLNPAPMMMPRPRVLMIASSISRVL